MSLECVPLDIPSVIEKIGAFIVVVGGFVLNTVMLLRQNKTSVENHKELKEGLSTLQAVATGTYKVLPEAKPDGT